MQSAILGLLRNLALAALSVVVTLATIESACWIANRLDPPQGSFCLHCRQSSGQTKPLAGPHGKIPAVPEVMAQRSEQLALMQPEGLDVSKRADRYFIRDDVPYYAPRAGKHRSLVRTRTGAVLYDVEYTIDSFGRRVVPGQSGVRKKFLLLMGCSFTFGEGVQDSETLPYWISRLARDYRVYNYAMSGYSPADVVLRFRNTDLSKEVLERGGIAAYVYYDDHLTRVLGPMSFVATWGAGKPYFSGGDQGNPRYLGSFQEGRPWTTRLYQALWRSQFVQRYRIQLPPGVSVSGLELFSRLLGEIRDVTRDKAGASRFVVIIAPSQSGSSLLIPYLERMGIEYINYAAWGLGRLVSEPAFIPYDGHPSARLHREMASYFVRDLGLESAR